MLKLWYKIKNNLPLLIICIVCGVVYLYDLFLIIFNLTQFIVALNNNVVIFGGFLGLNIFTIIINVVILAFLIVYYILSRRQTIRSDDESKIKNKSENP